MDLNQPFSWSAEFWEPFKMKLIWGLQSNDQGEPAVSYIWTGWVWKWLVEVQDCRKITDHFGRIYRIYLKLVKENRRMLTCIHRLDLQTLGSQPVVPKNLPNHCFNLEHWWWAAPNTWTKRDKRGQMWKGKCSILSTCMSACKVPSFPCHWAARLSLPLNQQSRLSTAQPVSIWHLYPLYPKPTVHSLHSSKRPVPTMEQSVPGKEAFGHTVHPR